jgi:hypothetical protein
VFPWPCFDTIEFIFKISEKSGSIDRFFPLGVKTKAPFGNPEIKDYMFLYPKPKWTSGWKNQTTGG